MPFRAIGVGRGIRAKLRARSLSVAWPCRMLPGWNAPGNDGQETLPSGRCLFMQKNSVYEDGQREADRDSGDRPRPKRLLVLRATIRMPSGGRGSPCRTHNMCSARWAHDRDADWVEYVQYSLNEFRNLAILEEWVGVETKSSALRLRRLRCPHAGQHSCRSNSGKKPLGAYINVPLHVHHITASKTTVH